MAIFGHPNGAYKEDPSLSVASSMAARGIATIAINAVGHGFGPLGTLTVSQSVGGPVMFFAGGRGVDQDGDGTIGFNEGLTTAPPRDIVFFTDGIRQTAADLMQLVRVIEVGMDVDGDGQHDLDSSRSPTSANPLAPTTGRSFWPWSRACGPGCSQWRATRWRIASGARGGRPWAVCSTLDSRR